MSVFLPKGTRDFMPAQMRARLRVIEILRGVFTRFGFEPLETPAFERIETLTGKYGAEGEKLMYRILERGEGGQRGEADLALRYDLTVPLARVLAMNPGARLPFKRYQIQPVWRAERPQKGRFREFWQCDVDIAGTHSPLADAECLAVAATAIEALGFREYVIRVNDRRILSDLAARAGATTPREEMSVLIALDKLDKIGRDGVERELAERGFSGAPVEALFEALALGADNEATLDNLVDKLMERGAEGVRALREVIPAAVELGVPAERIRVDPTLARGLDYYTGPVFEIEVTEQKVGSISGGGRYDGLIGMFSGRDVPAVGISLGLERIVTVMESLGMLPSDEPSAPVLVALFGDETRAASLRAARALREAGIDAELYVGDSRLKAQFKYANARGFRWLVVVGPTEAEAGMIALKDLASGGQEILSVDQAVERIRAAS